MGRRGDMPETLTAISYAAATSWAATLAIAAIIGGLVLWGDVRVIWSFSACSVLIDYALTNLCALRLPPEQRLYRIWPAWCGLVACLLLAWRVDWFVWLTGVGLIALEIVWHECAAALERKKT